MTGLTPRDYTRATLSRMGLTGSSKNSDNNRPTREDDNGHEDKAYKAAQAKNTMIYGAGSAPNMGRPGRATGGRIGKATGGALEAGGNKLSGQLVRTLRTPKEAHEDRLNEDGKLGVLMDDRPTRAKGGRTARELGFDVPDTAPETSKPTALGRNKGGRTGRAGGWLASGLHTANARTLRPAPLGGRGLSHGTGLSTWLSFK